VYTESENHRIALFIDFENIEAGVRKQYNKKLDIKLIIDALTNIGSVVVRRAYGDWSQHSDYRHHLLEYGIELFERPNLNPNIDKNGADIKLAIDALELAIRNTHIDTFAIVAGDSDFLSLIQKLKEYNRQVIVIAGEGFTSEYIKKNCDRFISYKTLAGIDYETITIPRSVVKLLERSILVRQENGRKLDAAGIKKQMLYFDPSFDEKKYGFEKFNDFILCMKDVGLPLKLVKRNGAWYIDYDDE